jgi:capsular polysaccharide export protein
MDIKKQNHNILIFVTSVKRADFFYEMTRALKKEDKSLNFYFVTIKLSAFLFLKKRKQKVFILQNFYKKEFDKTWFENFLEEALLVDKKIKIENEKNLEKNYFYLCSCFFNFIKSSKVEFQNFFIFNGFSQYIEYTAKLAAQYFMISPLFFEIGNFPDKFFIDKEGVNAASSLNKKDLTSSECDIQKFGLFIEKYLENKEKRHFVPQSKFDTGILVKMIDKFNRFEPSLYRYLIFQYKKRFLEKKPHNIFHEYDFMKNDYLFFPLQVSYDSQVLRFSDISLQEAIDMASKESEKMNLDFVVKLHPAETNYNIIKYVKERGGIIVKDNTYKLLKHAAYVITINSTVGLESFFYDKPLKVLGKAFYKKYIHCNKKQKLKVLCNYLENILVDGDYFNPDEKEIDANKIMRYIR